MPTIDRVAFTIFGLDIYWYALIIVIGMILGVTVAIFLGKKRGFSPDDMLDILLFVIPIAIICARLYYVVFEWDDSWTFAQIFHTRDGGLAIYGGVIGGFITALCVCRYKKWNVKRVIALLDCLVVGVILGQAIGRWGNFVNQEAFGNLVTNENLMFFPYAVLVNGSYYQATFFYESMCNFIIFAIMFTLGMKKPKITGLNTCLYFILYGLTRFFVEGLRSDSLYFMKEVIGEVIRVSQVFSAVLIVIGIVGLVLVKRGVFIAKSNE